MDINEAVCKSDTIMFAMLLSEIEKTGAIDSICMTKLVGSTGLTHDEINDLIERAIAKWERYAADLE